MKMTFTEDITMYKEAQRTINNLGHVLKEALQTAGKNGEVVVGVLECAHILQSSPDDVRLCVLEETDDVTVQIHHKLVEAFCWENEIPVIKVNNLQNMRNVLKIKPGQDIGCLLLQNITSDGNVDEFLNNCFSMLADQYPIVYLPE